MEEQSVAEVESQKISRPNFSGLLPQIFLRSNDSRLYLLFDLAMQYVNFTTLNLIVLIFREAALQSAGIPTVSS